MNERPHGLSQKEIESYRSRYGPGPHIAADLAAVTMCWEPPNPRLLVLVIRRGNGPYRGEYALPGGFVELDEDIKQGALRELREETGWDDLGSVYVEQLGTYGNPSRDPRARVVSVVFLALVPWHQAMPIVAGDDASEAKLFDFVDGQALDGGKPLTMAFDHKMILQDLRDRLRLLASHSSAPLLLCPSGFGLKQARQAYETMLGQKLDGDRFEEWIRRLGWLEAEGGDVRWERHAAHL